MLDKCFSNPEILRFVMRFYDLSAQQVATVLQIKEQSVRNACLDSGKGLGDEKLQFLIDLMSELNTREVPRGEAVAVPVWVWNPLGDPEKVLYVHRCPITGTSKVIRSDGYELCGKSGRMLATIPDQIGLLHKTEHTFPVSMSSTVSTYAERAKRTDLWGPNPLAKQK